MILKRSSVNYYFLVTVFLVGNFLIFSCAGPPPENLSGNWVGRQKVTVRYWLKNAENDSVNSPDSITMILKIGAKGVVTGSLGDAEFSGCRIHSTKNLLSLIFKQPYDYVITGSLKGRVFPSDTLMDKVIVAPCNRKGTMIIGIILQKQQGELTPMTQIHLAKQE